MSRFTRAIIVVLFIMGSLGGPSPALPAEGNVDGSIYTSPTYGYQLQWSSPWYFIEESSNAGTDTVTLFDSVSLVSFSFSVNPSANARALVGWHATQLLFGPDYSNYEPLKDPLGETVAGGDDTHAWGGIVIIYDLEDGSTREVVCYIDARILPGDIALSMLACAGDDVYDYRVLLGWQALSSTALILTDAMTPMVEPTAAPFPYASATPIVPAPPAFAAGPWRVTVRRVDQGATIDSLDLQVIEGVEWAVVYADVTNWSERDAELEVGDIQLVTAGGTDVPDPAATTSAATLLGLEPVEGTRVFMPAGSATRLALVYPIPPGEPALILEMDGTQVPLANAVDHQLDVSDLSTIVTPPDVQLGTVVVASLYVPSGLQFLVDLTPGGDVSAILGGVSRVREEDCGEPGMTYDAFAEFVDQEIWLEADPELPGSDEYYIWYENAGGNRVLLNQQLVAEGLVTADELPVDARFGPWLQQTEEVARANGVGLWSACAGLQ